MTDELATDEMIVETLRLQWPNSKIVLRDLPVAAQRRVVIATVDALTVVVKCVTDRSACTTASTLRRLGDQTNRASVLTLPRLFAVNEEHQIVVTSVIPGAPLHDVLAAAPARQAAVVSSVAAALLELHGLRTDGLRVVTIEDHINELIAPHPMQLAAEAPEWESAIRDALAVVRTVDDARQGSCGVAPIHRDFHLRQILIDNSTLPSPQVGVVDWDSAAAGDPLFDVAYFTSYLETHRLDTDGSLAAAFTAAYGIDLHSDGVIERLRTYRLFNLLRRACRRHRLADGGWRDERDRMMRLVQRQLTELRP